MEKANIENQTNMGQMEIQQLEMASNLHLIQAQLQESEARNAALMATCEEKKGILDY